MKALVDGTWHDGIENTKRNQRRFGASGDRFRGRIAADGSTGFPAGPGRYHLYVSYACPWAHRVILYRRLKKLEGIIGMSVLHPRWAGPGGWRFEDGPLSSADHVAGRRYLYEAYRDAKPDFTGRVTVPVLWDRTSSTIVSNESAEIIRMLNREFDAWGDRSVDFYPADLRDAIDACNAWLIPDVCAGVYKAGFAADQATYEAAVRRLFSRLDQLETWLAGSRFLFGERPTESDWHLFATLCRFDVAYVGALRCSLRRLVDYPALADYARRVHALPGVAATVRPDQIKLHYHDAIDEIDPTIVPLGPLRDYTGSGTDGDLGAIG